MSHIELLSKEFQLSQNHVKQIIELIDAGNTIPFIARYRKEQTGSCNDQVLRELNDRLGYLRNLDKRREEIVSAISEQEKMTPQLSAAISAAQTLAQLEDIYRPYRQKRRTRATVAREKGLAPLAERIFSQTRDLDVLTEAAAFVCAQKGVESVQDALAGAMDIMAEMISDDAQARQLLRDLFWKQGSLSSCQTKQEDSVYAMYYDYCEPISKLPSHRILAVNRGEKEGYLKVGIKVEEQNALKILYSVFQKGESTAAPYIADAITDAYKRLIFPSLEREIRSALTEAASKQAIKIFGLNLESLLMQPPIRNKVVLGLDPAYRTGCKIAVVDETGKVLDTTVVYPTPPQSRTKEAADKLKALINKHKVDAISIGNGTASKEAEIFVATLIKEVDRPLSYMVVNEAGASVYSASKLGAQEFPDFDVSLRSAVSIARRMQDPLAELVKIEPKSIGVGQYQHDMPEKQLDETLSGIVENCVNRVGVNLNTASAPLLSYVSGLSATVAKNIVSYREQNGAFRSRKQLNKVPKLGPRAYEQCAGFLRIPEADNIFDNTGVHPESYDAAEKLLRLLDYNKSNLKNGGLTDLAQRINQAGKQAIAKQCGIGVPTLSDIVAELTKPGRDLRDDLPAPMLRTDVMDLTDLKPGMQLTGTVRNVIDFGVFVDIGVHQDGLVHISQLSERYIHHPSEIVKVGDLIHVTVLDVDVEKKRISLSAKKQPRPAL